MDGIPIGQHPLVKQLFKGVYNSRPPQPRYTHTWDVQNHITELGDNGSLSLKQLSLKLVMLMSLTRASRVSELQALDLCFLPVYCEQSGVQIGLIDQEASDWSSPKGTFLC